ncbi:Trans-aconitate 2-methyltransferase [Penicillium chermesinum]|uniref:Trans-aconitate 2-methyltransferase n=1 Tax=Penicillium chermesinum TaxID=63820 RepID=A0A9W9NZV6_9EURO|nr:Trans-aconitate 2-methyltransferase [Penicillium chermesinum]KAJ5232939.1 Trans-aconitate 2-methyltransferase [Penicillium chermesinum]
MSAPSQPAISLPGFLFKPPQRIVDLGCGPGNSTAVLESRYPKAELVGMDSSPDMIRKAQSTLPHLDFTVEDLESYSPNSRVIKRLMETQPSGGVFAFQVPDNLDQPSHVSMRETAKNGPWAAKLETIGRDSFQSPREIYDALKPISSRVDVFHTSYYHALENHEAIVEWVKGTGLRPYLDPLDPQEKEAFLEDYLRRLKDAYPACVDGRVLLPYPRLFVVAVKN